MKVLAIESSGMTASVAVLTEEKIIGEYTTNNKMTHSQTILPMIDELLKKTGVELSDITHIAVSAGPGSFTGLRIGCATAKGISMALGIPVVSVPTLDAMAFNFAESENIICPMMDARRNRVFTGMYEFIDGTQNTLWEQTVEEIDDVLEKINSFNRKAIVLGDGAKVYESALANKLTVPYVIAPLHLLNQSAASVGLLGIRMINAGMDQSSNECKPIYLRPSQAEQEREAMKGNAV